MNLPTHEIVAQRAYQIWQSYGRPDERDMEIWFEAERQLKDEDHAKENSGAGGRQNLNSSAKKPNRNGNAETTERLKAETAAESVVENQISPAIPDEEAIKAALQKREARAPMVPHTSAPKIKPPESGKPLWSKPHSA